MERLSIRVRVWTIIIMLSLSVRQRIYLSASLLVALCIFTSVLGWLGQQSLLRNIQAFDATDAAISQVLEIDRNVQRLKGQSESYMHSGSTPVREDASRLLAAIITQIDEVAPLLPNGSFPYLLGEMRANLTTFGEQLQLASQERAIESSLVNTQLPRTITSVRSALRRIRDKAELSESAPALGLALDASTHVDAANTSMLQYVIHPNADDLTEMLASIDTASQKLAEYDGDPTMIEGELDTLDGALLAYRRLAVRTVQATRGYLYLSNVIMAGEMSEFVYFSNELKQEVLAQQSQLREERRTSASRNHTLTIVASVASVILAATLASGLVYSIVSPITKLTHAFKRLAAGDSLDDIPGTERQDELGKMSIAAQVFSSKNAETRELLAKYRVLSDELEQKALALQESNLELDKFAYVASHDLKAPLRGIKSLAEWVHEDCQDVLPAESEKHILLMRDRVEKMEALLNDLLDYSRVGRQAQEPEEVDLNVLVHSVIEIAEPPGGFEIAVKGELPTIHTVVVPLRQILLNLLTNAIKYNDKGDHGRVEILCEQHEDKIVLVVRDNGIGIEPRYHERIFQMYQRLAPDYAEGTGMGLAIVRKQVENFGGRVSVESEPGTGCAFEVTWPCTVQTTV